jgi:hypothetical protein
MVVGPVHNREQPCSGKLHTLRGAPCGGNGSVEELQLEIAQSLGIPHEIDRGERNASTMPGRVLLERERRPGEPDGNTIGLIQDA